MKEKKFQIIIKRSIDFYCRKNNLDKFYRKPPDVGFQNPFDCWILTKNGFTALELKVENKSSKLNFRKLFGYDKQYHELINLMKIKNMGHNAFVLIAIRQNSNRYKAYAFCPNEVQKYYSMFGSIEIEKVEHLEIDRVKNDITNELLYDLSPLIK